MELKEFLQNLNVKERSHEMFKPSGDKKCHALVESIATEAFRKDKRLTLEEARELFKNGVKKIAKTHAEVRDTEPPEHMAFYINLALNGAGYNFELSPYDMI